MGKKKRNQKKKNAPFKSNALLPARVQGESAVLPFRIKTEKDEDMQHDGVHEHAEDSVGNPWICPLDEFTVSQPIEFHQEIPLEKNSNFHMKKEPTDSPLQIDCSSNGDLCILTHAQNVSFNKESSVTRENATESQVFIYNEKSPLKRKLGAGEAPKAIRKKIKTKSVDDDKSFSDQSKSNQAANTSYVKNVENQNTNILSGRICEVSELDNDAADQVKKAAENSLGIKERARINDDIVILSVLKVDENIPYVKEKAASNDKKFQDSISILNNGAPDQVEIAAVDTDKNFEAINEEVSVNDDIVVLPVLRVDESIPYYVKEKSANDDKIFQDIQERYNVEDDVVILSVSKVEKSVSEVIVLDEKEDQDSGSINLAVEKSNKKLSPTSLQELISTNTDKERNFSTDILSYFNVVSEIDRCDCQSALDYLSDKWIPHGKTKETLPKFFPPVKGEINSRETVKGDILFKKRTTHSNLDSECFAISTNDYYSTPNNLVSQSAPESVTQNVNFPSLSTSHSAVLLHLLSASHASTNFELNSTPNLWTSAYFTSNSATEQNFPHISVDQLKEVLSNLQKDYDLMIPKDNYKISASGDNVQVTNTAVIDLQVPYQTSAQLSNCDFQRSYSFTPPQVFHQVIQQLHNHERSFSVTFPYAEVASSFSSVTRDPRVASKTTFPNRKGLKDLLFYRNVGKVYIHEHFEKIVLQWNPEWAEIQRYSGVCPPICDSYPYVTYLYPNEIVYYNTYVPLHMLHMWQMIFDWYCQLVKIDIKCKYRSGDKIECIFRILCSTELEVTERWPKRDDLVFLNYNEERAFARIIDVEKRSTDSESRMELKIKLESVHDFNLQCNDNFIINIIFNIRVEKMKTEALKLFHKSIKGLIVNPKYYAKNIAIIKLEANKRVKEQRDDILKRVNSEHVNVSVVETCDTYNTHMLIALLVYSIVFSQNSESVEKKQAKVFICLKNENSFLDLVKRLSVYNPVLAVRTKLISLPSSFRKFTFEGRLCRGETVTDILHKCHVFISTFSAFDLAEKSYMSKQHRLTCIVDEANLCTEAETALPLSLKLDKLLLIGKKGQNTALPSILMHYEYHISLFHRLLKAKQKF